MSSIQEDDAEDQDSKTSAQLSAKAKKTSVLTKKRKRANVIYDVGPRKSTGDVARRSTSSSQSGRKK